MAFDGVTTKAVVSELNNILSGSKVNKIFQPTKNEIIIEVYSSETQEKYNLLINSSSDLCRIHLTKHLKPNPQNAYNFCMLLRKYLTGSRIIEISNYDLERTVEIKFETYNELNDLVKRKLYVEIMSRQSNVILTNEKNVIIDTLKHYDGEKRELLPSHVFEFAPIQKTSFLELENYDEFMELIVENGEEKLSSKLPDIFIGFSKSFVLKTLEILSINDISYQESDLEKIYNYLKDFFEKIDTNYIQAVLLEKDFTIVSSNNASNTSINDFIDEYYFDKEQRNLFNNSKNNLLKVISNNLKKVYKKLENINQKLKECDDMEKYKLYGELLTANLYNYDNNLKLEELTVLNYYDNKQITIKLDNRYSLSKNVERIYKKYNKLKNTFEICSAQKKEAEREIDYIESVIYSLENCKTMDDIDDIYEEVSENFSSKKENNQNDNSKKKSNNEKVRPIEIDGFQVYVGKNNSQNDYITFKLANREDLWFHTQKIHGSHVVLITNGQEEIPENVIYECAKLAKENSKGKNSSVVSVDYCKIKFIKRAINGKLGMVNYTNFSTILVK